MPQRIRISHMSVLHGSLIGFFASDLCRESDDYSWREKTWVVVVRSVVSTSAALYFCFILAFVLFFI